METTSGEDLVHQLRVVLDVVASVVRATMFDRPDSSLTRIRRSLPTGSGVDVLVAGRVAGDAADVHAALVGEGALAHERLVRAEVHVDHLVDVARQLGQVLERRRRRAPRSPRFLTARLAITEIRSALPHRSPKPLIVPCTWTAPASTAASELATARSQSLWQWMPTGTASAGRRPRG